MVILLFLFVVVPIIEFSLLIQIDEWIGLSATLALVLLTGVTGATLAKRQGIAVLRRIQAELGVGRAPTDALLDGVLILVAGAVLITPGILTDLFGCLCLIPTTRKQIRKAIQAWFRRGLESGTIHYHAVAPEEMNVDREPPILEEKDGQWQPTERKRSGN